MLSIFFFANILQQCTYLTTQNETNINLDEVAGPVEIAGPVEMAALLFKWLKM